MNELDLQRKIEKTLNFDQQYVFFIVLGLKTSTIRQATDLKANQDVILTSDNHKFARAKIIEIKPLKFSEISEEVAQEDGFSSVVSLKRALKKYYPNLSDGDCLYQIRFNVIDILEISLIEQKIKNLINMALALLPRDNSQYNKLIELRELSGQPLLKKIKDEKIRNLLREVYLTLSQ